MQNQGAPSRPSLYASLYRLGKSVLRHTGLQEGHPYSEHELASAVSSTYRTLVANGAEDSLTWQDLMASLASLKWVLAALPVVEVNDRIAAALCTSSMTADVADELEMPWPAFVIEVPLDFMAVTDENGVHSVHSILVSRLCLDDGVDDGCLWLLRLVGDGLSIFIPPLKSKQLMDDALFQTMFQTFIGKVEGSEVEDMAKRAVRALTICKALVRGVLFRLSDPKRRAEYRVQLSQSSKAKRARRAKYGHLPDLDRYVFTDTVMIDARDTVRRYLDGERSSPSVRHLVRGHFRNQVCGTGRTERKRIWIHPHWRGEEGLPIATKNHRIVSA